MRVDVGVLVIAGRPVFEQFEALVGVRRKPESDVVFLRIDQTYADSSRICEEYLA